MMHRRWFLAVVAALLLAVHGTTTHAQAATEYGVKAAFVFNVANFVEWPTSVFPTPSTPIRVAVISGHPLPDFASTLTAKTIRGRSVVVETYEHAEQVGTVHIVFVAADAAAELRAAVKGSGGRPVLTIAEQPIETPGEAVISVGVSLTRLVFAVNLDAADAAELKISTNLLKLAKSVRSSRAKTK